MYIFRSFICRSTIGLPLILMAIILGLLLSRSDPLEEEKLLSKLLGPITDTYSASLVFPFLYSKNRKSARMISKIKTSLEHLDRLKLAVFDSAEKTFESSDEQITALDEADYFDFSGTAKLKYFIEQIIMRNEMYLVELISYGVVKVAVIPDVLLKDLPKKTIQNLKNEINSITRTFIPILIKKQRSPDSRMQKLSAFLASQELQLLANYSYSPANNNYYHTELTDHRKFAFGTVLRKVKKVGFYYAQYNHFPDSKPHKKMFEVLDSLKYIISIHQIMITTITMILIIILKVLLVQK